MKFFTRDWDIGAISDKQFEDTIASYEEHLTLHEPKLPENIARLARNMNFHDDLIIYVRSLGNVLEIQYLIGDLQVGYKSLTVRYLDWDPATFADPAIENAIRDRETEILADEVSITADGDFTHSLLFYPRGEMSIHFKSLEFEIKTLDQREIEYSGDPFILEEWRPGQSNKQTPPSS